MTTYRAYILDVTDPINPVTTVAYVQADKYQPAWQGIVATLNGDKDRTVKLFSDFETTKEVKLGTGDNVTLAKLTDTKPKKGVVIDAAQVQAIMNDTKMSPQQRLEAITALTVATTKKAPTVPAAPSTPAAQGAGAPS